MTEAAIVIARLPDGALRALAQGLRSGGLSTDSSVPRLADSLGVSADVAAAVREVCKNYPHPNELAFACDCTRATRNESNSGALTRVVELVLSGPTVEGVEMRETSVVFASLLKEAREEVLVTSFVAKYSRELLGPLADFLDADAARKATIILNFQRGKDSTTTTELVARLADDFWRNQWPRGARRPSLYYDPRGLAIEPTQRASMHAKVVVIDRRKAFVTSANLTARAQQENIELGVLVSHAPTAERIVAYFQALMANGHLIQAHDHGDRT